MKNKIVDIFCFSETVDSYLAAKKIANTLQMYGCLTNVENMTSSDLKKIDLSHKHKQYYLLEEMKKWNS